MPKLEGKIAVITGGSSGIGLSTARRFVEEGAYVFITGRRQSELDKAKALIGKNVTTVQGDTANLTDLDDLYAIVKKEKGAIDIIVASAGFVEAMPLSAATPEHFDRTFNVNTRAVFFALQKALPLLKNDGAVVLVSSASHMKGAPAYAAYSASKAALRSLARSWAGELKDRGIRVNALSPGLTDTPIIETQFKTKEDAEMMKTEFPKMVPLGRIGRPEEMASAILFLASSDSSYCTGIDLVVDGGFSQI